MSAKGGFTLIEIMGALVIFSVGVLAAMRLSGGLGDRLEYAALRTQVVQAAHERADSLRALGYDGLAPGTTASITPTLMNRAYRIDLAIDQYSPLVRRVEVTAEPNAGRGPIHRVTHYVATEW
jgi:prepilin-type N-terminal cleavage/methylation domain-containing protein